MAQGNSGERITKNEKHERKFCFVLEILQKGIPISLVNNIIKLFTHVFIQIILWLIFWHFNFCEIEKIKYKIVIFFGKLSYIILTVNYI